MKIEDKVLELIQPILDEENIKVAQIKYEKEDKNNILRIYLDTSDMDICVKAAKLINPILDKNNLIDEKYYLEVGSRGIEEE